MKELLKEYRVELIALLMVLLGVVLVVVPFSRETILKILSASSNSLHLLIIDVGSIIKTVTFHLSLADFLGGVLIFLCVAFIAWRVRFRLIRATLWRSDECPKCGSLIHRVHRKPGDRLWGRLLNLHWRRYQCENANCGWTGLRHGAPHHHIPASEDQESVGQAVSPTPLSPPPRAGKDEI